ncbi:hypothetical protein [Sphingobacterium pedocola]|uniref:DUF4340 domain-containing protein n=1 Tax=Sphingobacterium pedocola TaxID=2082722 RepID=A0ABR9T822_9SPHI|nr:hypothetical protein [Sphingobacterium pedocola]MBE8721029.1 hypothetical protein [Sphingobacterium pedocola]
MMRKFFFGLLIVILLLIGGVWIFFSVRATESLDVEVHKDSDVLIQVSVDQLLREIATNAIMHPFTYFEKDTSERMGDGATERIKIWQAGWTVPARLIFFSTPEDSAVFYSLQKISDVERFRKFALQTLDINVDSLLDPTDLLYLVSKNKRIALLSDEHNFILSVGVSSSDRRERMEHLLTNDNGDLVQIGAIASTDFLETKSDILYANLHDGTMLKIDFENGRMQAEGVLYSTLWKANPKARKGILHESNILNVTLDADLSPLMQKYESTLANLRIPVDTLRRYFGGYIDIQWKQGNVAQTDTIIAYEMDENFEMSEKKELREEWVPNLQITVKASPHLAGYIPEKIFYKFTKKTKLDMIGLATSTDFELDEQLMDNDTYFSFVMQNMKDEKLLLDWLSILEHIQKIELGATYVAPHVSSISGEIVFTQSKIHSLYQLMR